MTYVPLFVRTNLGKILCHYISIGLASTKKVETHKILYGEKKREMGLVGDGKSNIVIVIQLIFGILLDKP